MTFGARNIDRAPDVFTVKSMELVGGTIMNIDWIQRELENGATLSVSVQRGFAIASIKREGFCKTVQMLDDKSLNAIGSLDEMMKQDAMERCYPPNATDDSRKRKD